MEESIIHFAEQFDWNPEVSFAEKIKPWERIIVIGMGGSHLSADLLRIFRPALDSIVWRDYGLPQLAESELRKSLIVLSSYSGNTEEVLDAGEKAYALGLNISAISLGGTLKTWATQKEIPFISIPETHIQPRLALGFSLLALSALLKDSELTEELHMLGEKIKSKDFEKEGHMLAEKIKNTTPVIYTSAYLEALGYNWKIKCNETAKIPAFSNVFPELDHNEMAGFDTGEKNTLFSALFIQDKSDTDHILKRMDITQKIYEDRGLLCFRLQTVGESLYERIFNSLVLADWTAYFLAKDRGVEPEKVAIIEEFKQKIK